MSVERFASGTIYDLEGERRVIHQWHIGLQIEAKKTVCKIVKQLIDDSEKPKNSKKNKCNCILEDLRNGLSAAAALKKGESPLFRTELEKESQILMSKEIERLIVVFPFTSFPLQTTSEVILLLIVESLKNAVNSLK